MEHLFMQAFKSKDRVAAQAQHHVDSYSRILACNLLAAGHQPPEWLLPSSALPQDLNGKPIVLTGRQITTPAIDRTVFLPLAVPNTLSTQSGDQNVHDAYPDTNCTALGTTNQHEEQQQEQALLTQQLTEFCTAPKLFSRIQRSRSRQKHIEDRLHGGDRAAKSGSCDDVQDGMHKSNLKTVGSSRAAASSSSVPCDDVPNRAETTSGSGQGGGFCAIQGKATDFLKCDNNPEDQGVKLDSFPPLIVENKIICSGSNVGVSNNCAIRDSLDVLLPDFSKPITADSVCHRIPETHLLVEPKILQFDVAESVCMNPSSEQTCQQQESGLERLDLAFTNPSSEDPSTSSQGPHSMGRLLLNHVRSGHLNHDSASVEQHHNYTSECGHHDLTSMPSPNKKPSLTFSADALNSMGEPLLHKNTEHIPETNSLGKAYPKGIVDTDKPKSHVSPPCSGPLQLPTQLADARFAAHTSPGTSLSSLLGVDGCNHLSNLQKNDTNSRCSKGRSAVSLELLPPHNFISTDACQSTHLSYGAQSNNKHSSGAVAAVDASKSADSELSREQYLLVRPSLEFKGSISDVGTPLGHPPLGMQNEMLKADQVFDSVNRSSGKLGDDAHVSKAYGGSADNRKSESVVPKFSLISSSGTRNMQVTERNVVASSGKNNGKLRQGKEQETPHAKDDVQVITDSCTAENIEKMKSPCKSESCDKNKRQEDRGHAQKKSAADGVQINEGMSSKRKRIKCQDTVLPNSQDTNPLSPNHQDGIGTHVVTAEEISMETQPSGHSFLRRSGFDDFMLLKSEIKNDVMNHSISVASDVQQNEKCSPKLRDKFSLSEVALCNSSSAKDLSPNFNSGISSRNVVEEMDLQNCQVQNIFDVAASSPLASSSMELCSQEENTYLQGEGLSVANSDVEHPRRAPQVDETLSQSVTLNPANYCSTDSTNIFPSYALDQHGKQEFAPVALFHEKLSYASDVEVDRKFVSEYLSGCLLSDDTTPRQKDDDSVEFNDAMPQFESFDFSLPLDSSSTEESKFGSIHDSRQFGTFNSNTSNKYKMSTVSGMHQLLATMSGKAANCLFNDDGRQHSESIDGRITDIFGSSGLGHKASFITSDVVASCSSNAANKQDNGETPLTPSVEKYCQGKLSEKNGSVSQHMGSIPELLCFRIDEDSDIAEENDYREILRGSVGNQGQSGREALQDITGLCQGIGNSTSYSIGMIVDTGDTDMTVETCSSELNHHPDLRNDGDNKKPKESCASLLKKGGKMSHSLHNRLSKRETRQSEANPGKRSKPSNIVANVASFIPLVKPKVQPTVCVKKDVRVKALEAAEAAKRLEEKKQNEREIRKAAAKLEREKLKQEKELKQKQEEEQKKKRGADVATRKRQRDEEERREKERKKKCIEEARKQQKRPMERKHANTGKEAHPEAHDNKELQKNLAEAVRVPVKFDEMTGLGGKATNSNNEMVVITDERPAIFGSHCQENIPNSIEESYIMTPYKDSDDEDDDFEHKEESRRRRKLVPSWARGENLENILLSNYVLDARKIFARKCFSNLSETCPVQIPQRGFR
ncbi:uncharacterized protein LOC8063747 isoform X2 [Sorghum bicolor]|uniref:uncharacterized protein LOC8063747 isoform X2 n=1 Tax=Sorghum bicolor TaxID=4558 RepID=UPI000B4242B1|nr:uncharacterized protein LOC8063747 isoform X2 [Sorghum bicolor]|eukprot:XP_021310109.1 uncharacterized protein LOC8063747 isoform X2 [Sorghum bicolor]